MNGSQLPSTLNAILTFSITIYDYGLQRHRQVNYRGLYQNVFITRFLKVYLITAISPFKAALATILTTGARGTDHPPFF